MYRYPSRSAATRSIRSGSQGRCAPTRCAVQSVQTSSWSVPRSGSTSTLAPLRRVKNGSALEGEQLSHNEGNKLKLEAR
jgi:hypothetical protein